MASKQVEKSKATFTGWISLAIFCAVMLGIGLSVGRTLVTYKSTKPKPVTLETRATLETRVTCLEEGHDWEFKGVTYFGPDRRTLEDIPVWHFCCQRCGKKDYYSKSTMTDKFWRLVEQQSGLKRPQEKPVAIDIVGAKVCAPCSHQWSCVSFDNDSYLDAWDAWTFKCSKCNLTYIRCRAALREAELDLIEKWCGVRLEAEVSSIWDSTNTVTITTSPVLHNGGVVGDIE